MKPRQDRRDFLKTSAVIGAGYFAASGVQAQESKSAIETIRFACIGVDGKGDSDSSDAGKFGKVVACCDVDDNKLKAAEAAGADAAINTKDLNPKELKGKVKEAAKSIGAPKFCWKIFEMSGTKPGQQTGFNLLTFGSSMSVVGFTMDKVEARLSNLMAFDAKLIGNWGCDPELYSKVLDWVAKGKIQLKPYVEQRPLDTINEVFELSHGGKLEKRVVLVP